jgi:hypothetical protein
MNHPPATGEQQAMYSSAHRGIFCLHLSRFSLVVAGIALQGACTADSNPNAAQPRGVRAQSCRSDSDCTSAAAPACVNGICAAPPMRRAAIGEMCGNDGDCQQGLICQNNKCDVTGASQGMACHEDDDCGTGLSCQNGHCAPGMKADAGMQAAGSCHENDDCPSGQICMNGQCGSSGLPCDVQALLVSKCQVCHGSPPIPAAPFSLVTYDDLTHADRTNPSISVAQACVNRMQDTARPMPPGAGPTVGPMDIAAFQTWIQDGLPRANCGGSDAGSNPEDTGAACNDNGDCGAEFSCVQGMCVSSAPSDSGSSPMDAAAGCNDNGDCGAGFSCVQGQCVPNAQPGAGSTSPDASASCNDNADCPSGSSCVQGQCVPSNPPDAGTPDASPVDARSSDASSADAGGGIVGDPCLLDSDCAQLLICSRRGTCTEGCVLRPANCFNGYVCNTTTNHCQAPH